MTKLTYSINSRRIYQQPLRFVQQAPLRNLGHDRWKPKGDHWAPLSVVARESGVWHSMVYEGFINRLQVRPQSWTLGCQAALPKSSTQNPLDAIQMGLGYMYIYRYIIHTDLYHIHIYNINSRSILVITKTLQAAKKIISGPLCRTSPGVPT